MTGVARALFRPPCEETTQVLAFILVSLGPTRRPSQRDAQWNVPPAFWHGARSRGAGAATGQVVGQGVGLGGNATCWVVVVAVAVAWWRGFVLLQLVVVVCGGQGLGG